MIGRLLVNNGDEVAVGAPIAVLLTPGETQQEIERVLSAAIKHALPTAGNVPEADKVTPAMITLPSLALDEQTLPEIPSAPVVHRRTFASPVARLLARQHGIELDSVRGSGPNGRIVKYDVQLLTQHVPQPAAPAQQAAGQSTWTAIPHSNMRRTIARRLSESQSTVPHFYVSLDCRVDRLLELRAEINATQSQKISINDFVLKATAMALRELPGMNVAWTEQAVLQFNSVDICLAVSTEKGLMTPIIRDAANQSLLQISVQAAQLAVRARAGQLRPEEFQGGSFSVSNLGMYGIEEFSAIINPPQSGILAVGAVRQEPVINAQGQVVPAQCMRCTLSVDHRSVDGAMAARWLAAFRQLIQAPVSLLL